MRIFLFVFIYFILFCFNAYGADRVFDSLMFAKHIFFKDNTFNNAISVHMVEVNLNNPCVNLGVALPKKSPNSQAPVNKLASWYNAIAAINGSFFHIGQNIVAPVGLLMVNGEILSDSGHRRTSLGIKDNNELIIGIPQIKVYLSLVDLGKQLKINGINQVRKYRQTIVYTPYFGKTTKTNQFGREIIVRNNQVIGYKICNSEIPKDGFVISIHGASKDIVNKIPIGTFVTIDTIKSSQWENVKTIITGGPHLVHKGKIYNTYYQENMHPSLKYPNVRSALGITHNKKLLLLTATSKATYTQIAYILKRLGAIEAMGLDGGSSSGLYLKGKILNTNSYKFRPVNNAIIVTAKKINKN